MSESDREYLESLVKTGTPTTRKLQQARSLFELGRVPDRSVTNMANSTTTNIYDSLGRIAQTSNPVGTFTPTYDGVTSRVLQLSNPNVTTNFLYFGNTGDRRLQQIKHQVGTTLLSQYDYTYQAEGEIATWTRNQPGATPAVTTYTFGYDNADQITSAVLKDSGGATLSTRGYTFDPAGNRLTETGPTVTNFTHNTVNQINGFTFDNNGSLTSGGGKTCTWDAANRLVKIEPGNGKTVDLSYNGLGQCVKIVETDTPASTVKTRFFTWADGEMFLEAFGPMVAATPSGLTSGGTRRYVPQGYRELSTRYFYTRDHLGSVREVVDVNGVVQARYDYDPWGRATRLSGTLDAPFGYAGYFNHTFSGLNLTWFRAYDPNLGRWLSRDPIGEGGGLNLYEYVENDPISEMDLLGLQKSGGPWHPPVGVSSSCQFTDSCEVILGKMTLLSRMIKSHTGWDRHMGPPRGGGRHADEIGNLWRAYAKCQDLWAKKNCSQRKQCEAPVPFRLPVTPFPLVPLPSPYTPTPLDVAIGVGVGAGVLIAVCLLCRCCIPIPVPV